MKRNGEKNWYSLQILKSVPSNQNVCHFKWL